VTDVATAVVRARAALRAALASAPRPVGLIPTMGWLHDGHRALMQRARAENATTVVSIFVNPRQFGDPKDLARYPRNEARDVAIAEAEGIDLVFAPGVEEIYPPGSDTTVRVGAVVAILFDLIGAERAYFGQKDAQQVLVVRQMARDLAIPTEVIACPTIREPDGLAMSSRNVHLSPEERAAAPVLRQALLTAREAWADGERSGDVLRERMRAQIAGEPVAVVDYVSVADAVTLRELDRVDGSALLSLAVRFGTTRLIDNEALG